MSIRTLVLCGVALSLHGAPASGLDAASRSGVVAAFADLLTVHYVYPDAGRKLAQALRADLAAGRFDAAATATEFAQRLTEIAQRETRDKHMNVFVAPPADPAAPPPHAIGTPEQLRQSNHGFERVMRLPGNIGYLDLRYFDDTVEGKKVAAATMAWLTRTDALIVDLRKNIGGEPDMVRFLQSYLFAAPTLLNSLQYRDDTRPGGWRVVDFVTLADVPGPRYAMNKAIAILTSRDTFSAGEEFAYNLQTRKRATIIGETTGGGAHPGEIFKLGAGLAVYISNGRAVNPVTRTNWEGAGVKPDIELAADQALRRAQTELLGVLIAAEADAARRAALKQRVKALEAGAAEW